MSGSITTDDRLLDGRVALTQSRQGYRVAIDPVLLAASIAATSSDRILDAGCGTGAAALCLAARVPDCKLVGVERQSEAVALARANVAANGLDGRIKIEEVSFSDYAILDRGGFTQVMMNPPFYENGKHTRSPHLGKWASHGEEAMSLEDWIAAAAMALQADGRLTLIHRADRVGDILTSLGGRFGALLIFPLWPCAGLDAKRVLISAIKGRKTLPRILPGLVLHDSQGGYTAQAEAILRDARTLDLAASSA